MPYRRPLAPRHISPGSAQVCPSFSDVTVVSEDNAGREANFNFCIFSSTGKLKLIRWQSCHEVNIVFLINFQRSFSSNKKFRSGKYIVCGEAMTKEGEIMQVEKKNIKKIKGCQKKSSSTFCIQIIMTILT